MKKQIQLLERGIHTWSADSVRLILTPSATAKNLYFYTQETGYFKTSYPYFSERQNLDSFLIDLPMRRLDGLNHSNDLQTR